MLKRSYRKFFLLFLNITALLLVAVMLFNYFVDPGNQFSHGALLEKNMANALLNNKKLIVQANYNERLLQKMMIARLKEQPDILVLGSSHVMPLTHDDFDTPLFFNASVSSANLEDDVALFYLLHQRGYQPKTIIICLDPWIVSKDSPESLWKTEYIDDYAAGKSLILRKPATLNYFTQAAGFLEKYEQLLSSAYLTASINKFISSWHKQDLDQGISVLSNMNAICANCFVRQPDGARLPTPNEEKTSSESADTYVINNINGWTNFWTRSSLDPNRALIFKSFVTYLIDHHITVVFYFPPLEPSAYTQLVEKNKNYQMVLIAQQYFERIAKKYDIKTIGSYNPTLAQVDKRDFIDNWHLKKEGIDKLFQSNKT